MSSTSQFGCWARGIPVRGVSPPRGRPTAAPVARPRLRRAAAYTRGFAGYTPGAIGRLTYPGAFTRPRSKKVSKDGVPVVVLLQLSASCGHLVRSFFGIGRIISDVLCALPSLHRVGGDVLDTTLIHRILPEFCGSS